MDLLTASGLSQLFLQYRIQEFHSVIYLIRPSKIKFWTLVKCFLTDRSRSFEKS